MNWAADYAGPMLWRVPPPDLWRTHWAIWIAAPGLILMSPIMLVHPLKFDDGEG